MKKTTLTLIISIITIFAFGQKTLPDTLYNTEFIDVVRIKDTVIITGKYSGYRETLDEITFSNGKKIYNKSGFLPAISENGKMIAILNYHKNLYQYVHFSEAIFDVYNYEGELVKSYPVYIEKEWIYKIIACIVFNNGDLLAVNTTSHMNNFRLYFYRDDKVVRMFDQINANLNSEILTFSNLNLRHSVDCKVIFVKLKSLYNGKYLHQFHFFDYSGNLIASYDIIESYSYNCYFDEMEFNKLSNQLIINYELKKYSEESISYELIFDITTKKFTNNEK